MTARLKIQRKDILGLGWEDFAYPSGSEKNARRVFENLKQAEALKICQRKLRLIAETIVVLEAS